MFFTPMFFARIPIRLNSALCALLVFAAPLFGYTGEVKAAPSRQPEFTVAEMTVAELQEAIAAGRITSRRLTALYLKRIKAIDQAGPHINSVIELNPDALEIASALDQERKAKGPRGPLHGIPVLIKDNIATADQMQTTAGSLALIGAKPLRDSFVAMRLREAGAVILGKTNLSEWANFRSTRSTSGWSARGGLTRNPYALDRNTSGSSSGSGAAIASSLAAVAIGTETDGSIVSPSSINGIVGIKPTVGLVSRAGIIPISHSQDTAGPMTRTVADAAAVLTVLAGSDARDDATHEATARAIDYTRALDPNALKGARLGVVRSQFGGRNDLVSAEIEKALAALKANGAILVDVAELPNNGKYAQDELEVLTYELKAGLAAYFVDNVPNTSVKTLGDLIAFNDSHKTQELQYFGQEHFIRAEAKGGFDSKEYLDALAASRRLARESIDNAMSDNNLDALIAPTTGTAWMTDFIKGDNGGGGFSTPAAVAGYPHVTVPAGFVQGLPFGLSFVATAWSEQRLIALAYAFEQATQYRRPPTYPKSVNRWNGK
jgi:amidase